VDEEQKTLLQEVQVWEFTVIELTLFLDTHPNDRKAMDDFRKASEKLRMVKMAYEKKYGPLTATGLGEEQRPWQWAESPWPWELTY
jgi:spore coat protein JB